MNATSNKFKASFCNWPSLYGDEYIEADLGGGVTVRAYVEHDPYANPEPDNAEDVEAFNADRLRYCTMTLNVYIDGQCIARGVAALYQIGVDEDGDNNGNYLTECANDLLDQIDIAKIVAGFAKKAADAARAVRR